MVHSVLDALVSHIVDAFQAGLLRVCQHNVPDGVAHMAQPIGNAEPEAMDWVGVNLQRNVAERSRGLKFCPSPIDCTGALGLIQHEVI